MRLLTAALITFTTLIAHAAVPLPDTPTVSDLQEFRLSCQSLQSTIGLMESTGQKEKAAAFSAQLWERYDAEVAARRSALADLSLVALNPFLPNSERQNAIRALGSAVAELAQLATFSSPSPAQRLHAIELAGGKPTELQRTRAETHATLQKIRHDLSLLALAHPAITDLLRDSVAQLTRAAAAKQPLAPLIATAREIPASRDAFKNLTEKFGQPDVIEALFYRTGESLAVEATLTALIEADPTNATFWLARARARLKLGWRAGAALDATIARHLAPDLLGLATFANTLKQSPVSLSAVCQEWVDPDDAMEVMRLHRVAEMAGQPATELAPALERSARAAVRNRARRLYATSFVFDADLRRKAIPLIAEENPVPPGLFPFVGPELGRQYQAEIEAAATDGARYAAIQQRYAALFGVTEGFWNYQVVLLLRSAQREAAIAATDLAEAQFARAAWIKEARAQIEKIPAPDKK